MARIKRAINTYRKCRVVLERVPDCRDQRSRLYYKAEGQLLHFFNYNFHDRKAHKGDFRKLQIQRINATARTKGITCSRLVQGLRLTSIELDRRTLVEVAVSDPSIFKIIADVARAAPPEDVNTSVEV